jgi:ElaB/YqjD/DUF883 family membrane-anchored ribosome-binding protein
MGLTDKLKDLATKAEDDAAAHKDQIHKAVLKAEEAADQRTGGQYHDRILKAGQKADAYVDGLKEPDSRAAGGTEPPPAE